MAFLDTAAHFGTASNTTYYQNYAQKAYYEKLLLKNLVGKEVLGKYAKKASIPGNLSKTIEWTRVAPLGKVSAVTEGENPTAQSPTFTKITGTVGEYAAAYKMSALWSQTTFEQGKGAIESLKQQMLETREWILMKAVVEGATTNLYANGVSALSSLAYTDTLKAGDLRDARTTLMNYKAEPVKDGYFVAAVGPTIFQSLIEESNSPIVASYAGESGSDIREWKTYNYAGVSLEMATLDRYYVNNAGTNSAPTAGAVGASYYNLCGIPVFGKEAFAKVDLEAGGISPYNGMKYGEIIMVTNADSNNPTLAYISMGFRFPMAAAVIQPNAVCVVYSSDPDYATA